MFKEFMNLKIAVPKNGALVKVTILGLRRKRNADIFAKDKNDKNT